MKKLYRTEVTVVAYFLAEEGDEDLYEEDALNSEVDNNGIEHTEIITTEVTDFAKVEPKWQDAIFYNQDGPDCTVRKWFEQQPPPSTTDPKQLNLFPEESS